MKNLTLLYLNPSGSLSGNGIDISQLDGPITTYLTSVCQTLQEELIEVVTQICKYRKQPLCPDNELTRALKKLCDIYHTYRKNCC